MRTQEDQLAYALTGKENLAACTAVELEQLVSRYPYFVPAHYLLELKNKETGNSAANISLYFNNPLLLESRFGTAGDAVITPAEKESAFADYKQAETIVTPEPVPQHAESVNSPTELSAAQSEQVTENISADLYETGNSSEEIIAQEDEPEVEKELNIPKIRIEPIDPEKTALTFEPYHTVDYFASQGIKVNESEKPADAFGQQLKRFTDWLKVMKKLPVTEIQKTADPNSEQKVDQLAEHSLEEKEVLTETMAEVWEKQGNHVKAIEIYNKLSLLDPAKSAYFAAKIAGLKK